MKISEFKQLLNYCKELEISTVGELARFKAEEEKGNLMLVMARYLELSKIYKRIGE